MITNFRNIILNTDSYKASHYLQYPPGTEYVSSYVESRGGKWDETVFFGIQAFIKEYMLTPITMKDIDEAEWFFKNHGEPFNRAGWERIVKVHGGLLPVRIQAVPEGTVVPVNNVLVQIINTDPQLPWVTSYVETMVLRAVWYGTTVATQSWQIKRDILAALRKTAIDEAQISFKLHDFGARGVSSEESAGLGGAAHLINFMGTDTMTGILVAMKYYNTKDMVGFSIPAAEHSTTTSWGGPKGERAAFENMLKQFGKNGALLAVVSDSYNIYHAVEELWGNKLKKQVLDTGACVVIRPDSGTPWKIVPEVISLLMEKFGYTTNEKGYKVLPPCVRVIQGDGINQDSIRKILKAMDEERQSADNIAFGMGGALLQSVNRDTQRFAMKASAICVNGEWRDVYKDPITDPGKTSKKGRLALIQQAGLGDVSYQTVREQYALEHDSIMKDVYVDGKLLVDDTFAAIRERAQKALLASMPDSTGMYE